MPLLLLQRMHARNLSSCHSLVQGRTVLRRTMWGSLYARRMPPLCVVSAG